MDTIYYAAAEGFIEGKYRKVGDKIGALSEARAKYPLLAGQITSAPPAKDKASPAPKKDDT
ncbi:hypothetical protein KL86PLE_90735 [uncultured Pleomorphomonas sp.]|uniref:Uncharacterized protein n=1 Tax=uncultured Pleomorphomonas sp. TaxID=442121 RepID=A0A212LR59_9HYPH|nr:hypothetical protein [uncultured Pleomorphomonas sp.]SCM79971.1 hypothetical protein KL86PLE_90735 [uncultured Pleomorphomonas sp.]